MPSVSGRENILREEFKKTVDLINTTGSFVKPFALSVKEEINKNPMRRDETYNAYAVDPKQANTIIKSAKLNDTYRTQFDSLKQSSNLPDEGDLKGDLDQQEALAAGASTLAIQRNNRKFERANNYISAQAQALSYLRVATEYYNRGDYEKASKMLESSQASAAEVPINDYFERTR